MSIVDVCNLICYNKYDDIRHIVFKRGNKVKVVFECHIGESEKLINFLNQKKKEGYAVTNLELVDGLATAVFEKCTNDFVYTLDYSKLYADGFNDNDEYYDIAKLNGWKLQCYTKGLGIWINEDIENAVPFFLEEEYCQIKNDEYQKRIRSIKITAVFNTIVFIFGIKYYIYNGKMDIFYGLPFAVFYYYTVYDILIRKRDHPKIIIEALSVYFTGSMYLVPKISFLYSIVIEFIFIIICFCLLKKDSFILKKWLVSLSPFFWIILFIVDVIFGG